MEDPKETGRFKKFLKSLRLHHWLGIIFSAIITTIVGMVLTNILSGKGELGNQHPDKDPNLRLIIEKEMEIESWFDQIDSEVIELEKKRLVNEVSKKLEELNTLTPNRAKTFFLWAELYQRNNDPDRVLSYLEKAEGLNYTPMFDIYVARGLAYRELGNLNKSKGEFSLALFSYEKSEEFFSLAIKSDYTEFHDVHIPRKHQSEVELEIKACKAELSYLQTFDSNFTGGVDSNITEIEITARYFYNNSNYIKAARCYFWLHKQDLNETRLKPLSKSFERVSEFWEYPPNDEYDILYDINNNSVYGIINHDGAKFLETQAGDDTTIIRQLDMNEVFEIIGRSDSRQLIDGVNVYWYKVCADNNTIGWIYGKYLWVFPNSIEWKDRD